MNAERVPAAGARSRCRVRAVPRGDFAEVFDRSAATYDIVAFPFFTRFGEALVDVAQVRRTDRVIDVGCGAGAALAPAARVARSATGVELSPAMAERAQAAAPDAQVIVGDAAELPFEDCSFDLVLSSFVVFFMPDPTAALREWRRVLAPGGRIVMSTWGPPDQRWRAFERPIRGSFVPEMDPDEAQDLGAGLAMVDRFSESANVETELRAAGFREPEVTEHAVSSCSPTSKPGGTGTGRTGRACSSRRCRTTRGAACVSSCAKRWSRYVAKVAFLVSKLLCSRAHTPEGGRGFEATDCGGGRGCDGRAGAVGAECARVRDLVVQRQGHEGPDSRCDSGGLDA